jgi:hypothetical protein
VTDLVAVRRGAGRTGSGRTCRVTFGGPGMPTTHEVTVTAPDLARLAPGASTPDDLVRRSFAFLLAREPRESILRRFGLSQIGRHFPEDEREIRSQGTAGAGSCDRGDPELPASPRPL